MPEPRIVPSPPFGDRYDFDVPPGTRAVVLFRNNGGGRIPVRLLLPHQVYVKDVEELLVSGARSIEVLPVSNDLPYIQIASAGW